MPNGKLIAAPETSDVWHPYIGMHQNNVVQLANYSDIQYVLNQAYTSSNKPYFMGSYTGNGTNPRKININFTPSAVFLIPSNGEIIRGSIYGGLFGAGLNLTQYFDSDFNSYGAHVVTNGFKIVDVEYSGHFNVENVLYYYLCFR